MTTLTYNLNGSGSIFRDNLVGLTVTNITTAEVATALTDTGVNPAKVIQFTATWVVDPVADDVIQANYDGAGTFRSVDGVAMDAVTFNLTNCLNGTNTFIAGFGDSFMDPPSGYIGTSLLANSNKFPYSFTEFATGGDNLATIRTKFDANYLTSGATDVILQGSINNFAGVPGNLTDVQTAVNDMSYMADIVIGDGVNLAIVGLTPFKGHPNWTTITAQQVLDFNAAIKAKYPNNYVDAYTPLADPADSQQLADEFYKLDRTDLHPNKNADKLIDVQIGKLIYNLPVVDLTNPAGSYLSDAKSRDLTVWSLTKMTIGGSQIELADGSLSSATGLISTILGIDVILAQVNSSTVPPNNQPLRLSANIMPGLNDFAWMQFKDSSGGTYQAYVDLINVAIGNLGGTGANTPVWSVTPSARGFVTVQLLVDNSATGSAVCNIDVRPIDSLGSQAATGDLRSPNIYLDAIQLEDQ